MKKSFSDMLSELVVLDNNQCVLGRAYFANFADVKPLGTRDIYYIRKGPNIGRQSIGIRTTNTRTTETP